MLASSRAHAAHSASLRPERDLTIRGNDATLGGAVVFGELRVEANDALLVYNRLQGAATFSGNDLSCNANVAFADADADADGVVDDAELGAELVCPAGKNDAAESGSDESSGGDDSSSDDSSPDDSSSDDSSSDDSSSDDEPAANVDAVAEGPPRKPRARSKPAG